MHRTSSEQDRPANGASEEDEAELLELATSALNRRFINSFLHLIGKVFTNIGMETFEPALAMLRQGRKDRQMEKGNPSTVFIGGWLCQDVVQRHMYIFQRTTTLYFPLGLSISGIFVSEKRFLFNCLL